MLDIDDLTVTYGSIEAVRRVSFKIETGSIVTMIGPNGAGKTTILNSISGVIPVRSGRIHFEGRDITRTSAHKRVSLGVIQVPEGRQVLAGMTVRENLELGGYRRSHREVIRDATRMARPKLLLLDEPSLGLAPKIIQTVFELIGQLHDEGLTILLVEQNAHLALAVSSYAYVIESGKITLEGPAEALSSDKSVIRTYLGQAI